MSEDETTFSRKTEQLTRLLRLQPSWNIDQVLIWMVFKNPVGTARAQRSIGADRETWDRLRRELLKAPDAEKHRESFAQAELMLLDRLMHGDLKAEMKNGLSFAEIDQRVFRSATLLAQTTDALNYEAVFYIGEVSKLPVAVKDYGFPLQRLSQLDDYTRSNLLRPTIEAVDVIRHFPMVPKDTGLSRVQDHSIPDAPPARNPRSVTAIIEQILSVWSEAGEELSSRPTQDSVLAAVLRERPAESRTRVREAFKAQQSSYPHIHWNKTGPRHRR